MKSLKIIRRYIKKVEQEIFYCGFPESSLDKIKVKAVEKGFKITETGDKKIIITHIPAKDDYKNWIKNQQELNEAAVQYTKERKNVECRDETLSRLKTTSSRLISDTGNIIRQIQQYPLENTTPMETMLFVQKLKQSAIPVLP